MRKTKRRMDDWTRDYSSVWGRERPLRYVSMGCITGSGGCRTDGLQHWEEGSDSTGRDGLGAGARIHGGWAATTLVSGPSSLPPGALARTVGVAYAAWKAHSAATGAMAGAVHDKWQYVVPLS